MPLLSCAELGRYHGDHSCGYCGGQNARSFGFVTQGMRVETYEALINRGWRRSGRYMYKPDLKNTCCRLYAIRMEATTFKSRREHRKDVHRFNRYIKGDNWDSEISLHAKKLETQRRKENTNPSGTAKQKAPVEFDLLQTVHAADHDVLMNTPRPGGLEPAHKLTLELDSDAYTEEKYALYVKYQNIIHRESMKENSPSQFKRFLCSSPFMGEKTYEEEETGKSRPVGTYHHLYRIDGKLIAFGVLDLLPHTVSSVYFVYDPDEVGKFGMGKVSALREVAMCIEGGYKYYGLGLFASGCEKLRYKGEIQPSELLDPESYVWHPFEKYKPFFDQGQTYVTFEVPDIGIVLPDDPPAQVRTVKPSPFGKEEFYFANQKHHDIPYHTDLDSQLVESLFETDMPGVHSRESIVRAEPFWGQHLLIYETSFRQETGRIVKYWMSQAVKDKITREEIRELVAILGTTIFEIAIIV